MARYWFPKWMRTVSKLPCKSILIEFRTVASNAFDSTRHSKCAPISMRVNVIDSSDFTVVSPFASSCITVALFSESMEKRESISVLLRSVCLFDCYVPFKRFPDRYHPTNGSGLVFFTKQILVNSWPSRNGPTVVSFAICFSFSSSNWIAVGVTTARMNATRKKIIIFPKHVSFVIH